MTQLLHHEIIEHPTCKIIGRAKRVKPLSPEIKQLWEDSFKENLFDAILQPEYFLPSLHPDTIGAMYDFDDNGEFTYIVGTFLSVDAPNNGYDEVIFPAGKAIITWVSGSEREVYGNAHELTETKLKDLGYQPNYQNICGIEIYTMERFMKEQEKGEGKIILDYLIPLK